LTKLLEKQAIYDNQTISFILSNWQDFTSLSGNLLENLLVELIKHYSLREESHNFISLVIKKLAADHIDNFTQALR
jgi:hypothetical protein